MIIVIIIPKKEFAEKETIVIMSLLSEYKNLLGFFLGIPRILKGNHKKYNA